MKMVRAASLRPAKGVETHVLDGEGVLFDARTQRLYRLNGTANCIWSCLRRGGDIETVATGVNESLQIGQADALAYATRMVDAWERLGLLEGSLSAPNRRIRAANPQARTQSAGDKRSARTTIRKPRDPVVCRCYRLLNTTFCLEQATKDLDDLVHPVLQHLHVPGPGAHPVTLDLVKVPRGYHLLQDRQLLVACGSRSAVAPLVKGYIVYLALRRYSYFMAFHAGAVAFPGGYLLIPGSSGSGKTTLTAALLTAGWCYVSDDIVVLKRRRLDIAAVPLGLCIKEGGWSVLASRYPDLAEIAVHLRHDGKLVRYLPPPSVVHRQSSRRTRWVVFPQYDPATPSELRPLSRPEGIHRLFANCFALPEVLTAAKVRRLIRWAADIDFFDLAVADLDVAVARIAELTGNRDPAP